MPPLSALPGVDLFSIVLELIYPHLTKKEKAMALNMKPVVIRRSQVNEFLKYLSEGKKSQEIQDRSAKPTSK